MDIEAKERTERRLAAILAADVVGYSRLMGADEEGTHFALKAVRREVTDPKIDAHHGRIVKTTGDGLLVEFASVVDAVRCAVDIQREMKWRNALKPAEDPIVFRIGINLGDIISTRPTYSATASTSRHGSKGWPTPAGFASAGSCATRCATSSASVSRIWVRSGSKTLPGRCTSFASRSTRLLYQRILCANPDPVPTRRGVRLVAAVGGSAAVLGAILLLLRISPGPVASPPRRSLETRYSSEKTKSFCRNPPAWRSGSRPPICGITRTSR